MRSFLIILALGLFALVPMAFAQNSEPNEKPEKAAQTTAIFFFAESCGACKILKPEYERALTSINQDRLETVTFDFSSKDRIEDTRTLAADKNLMPILMSYGAKTGFVVLTQNGTDEISVISMKDDAHSIAAKITNAMLLSEKENKDQSPPTS